MDVPGPVSTVDVHQAQRDGLARLRRRRRGAVAAAGVAVVVAATLSLTLPGGDRQAVGPAQPGSPSPVASHSASALPTFSKSPLSTSSPSSLPGGGTPVPSLSQTRAPYSGRAPITVEADFGWLPADVNSVRYTLSPYGVTIHATAGRGMQAPIYRLTAYPAGTTPELADFPTGAHAIRVPAPEVNGQEAYWVSSDDPGYAEGLTRLRWKAPDGRWLELDNSYLEEADRQPVTLRIAAGVTAGRRSIPLPLRIDGIPSGYVLSSSSFERQVGSDKEWRAELNYSSAPGKYFSTAVTPDGTEPGRPASGPAGSQSNPGTCKAADGVRVCVTPLQTDALAAGGGPQAWLDRITLLGTDSAKWTTDVLN
ncbi:hypothetical protein [Kitasatospora sp. P5_F3]